MESSINKVRQSNFELLRIISIFGIILHHLVIKGASTCGYIEPYDYGRDGVVGLIINSFVIGGVNCFVLITGWFGISHPCKAFSKVFLETVVFGLISYIFVMMCTSDFSLRYLFDSVDFRNNWFANSYIMLLLLSPIIEKSLLGILYEELKRWIILLSVFNVIFVFGFHNLNSNGYNVVQFVYLYYIARFLRLGYDKKKWCCLLRKYSVLIYVAAALCLSFGLYELSVYGKPVKSIVWFGYNQPIVMILSIAFFITFAKLNITSSLVNDMSKSVFGVFVLHTTIHLIPIRNEFAHNIYLEYGYFGIFSLTIAVFVVCMSIALPCSLLINKLMARSSYSIVKGYK